MNPLITRTIHAFTTGLCIAGSVVSFWLPNLIHAVEVDQNNLWLLRTPTGLSICLNLILLFATGLGCATAYGARFLQPHFRIAEPLPKNPKPMLYAIVLSVFGFMQIFLGALLSAYTGNVSRIISASALGIALFAVSRVRIYINNKPALECPNEP